MVMAGLAVGRGGAPAAAAVRCLGPCIAEIADPTVRPAGAIGLIGDSVLMGVDPWIGTDLAAAGWGPFHYWAGTGTRVPADNPLGASTVVRQWRAARLHPPGWSIRGGAGRGGLVRASVGGGGGAAGPLLVGDWPGRGEGGGATT